MSAAIAAILAVALAVLAGLLAPPLLRRRRRRLAFGQALPAPLRTAIARNVPITRSLPPELARRLDGLVLAFLAEKRFVGCNGLAITDEIRGTIAAQSCLLLLGRAGLYDDLRSILVYPGTFWVEDEVHDDDGLVTRRRRELSGEAWDSQPLRVGAGGGVWVTATVLRLGVSVARGRDADTHVNFGFSLGF